MASTVRANTLTHPIIRRNIRWYFRIDIPIQNVFFIYRFLIRIYLKVSQNFHLNADDDPKKSERRCGREPCIAGLISVEVNELACRSLALLKGQVPVVAYLFHLWCRMIEQRWRLENARPRKIDGLPWPLHHLVMLNDYPRITDTIPLTQTDIPVNWEQKSVNIIHW